MLSRVAASRLGVPAEIDRPTPRSTWSRTGRWSDLLKLHGGQARTRFANPFIFVTDSGRRWSTWYTVTSGAMALQ
jgi:hypothetical protein